MADVTFEDQESINLFSRLNTRHHEIEAQIKAKKALVEDLEEAGNEVMLLDDDAVPFVVGECFAHLPREEVETKVEQMKEEAEEEVKKLEKELAAMRAEMASLKTVLYAKFGNTINLED